MRIVVSLLGALFVPVYVSARPPAVFGSYEWAHPDFENVHLFTGRLNGWQTGVVVPLAGGFEIVEQMDGLYGEAFSTGIVVRRTGTARPWLYAVEAGPRYSVQSSGRIQPVHRSAIRGDAWSSRDDGRRFSRDQVRHAI